MSANDCPTPATLEQLLTGDLPDAAASAVRDHVHACAPCQAVLDRLAECTGMPPSWPGGGLEPEAGDPGPALARVLEALRAMPSGSDAMDTVEEPLSPVLGAPRQAGDLGALGPYRIQAELGRGGMGVVYRAYDDDLQRTVAIKVLRPELAGDPAARARFVREGQAAARVRHEHLVSVHAVVQAPDGLPYLVLEYVAGPTLAALIRARRQLAPREAAAYLAQAADGLAAAHAAGLVHRDIKPGNILLQQLGEPLLPKITDFGLARFTAGAGALTQPGAHPGTPAYMSPEQAGGRDDLDARSDVYSLGVTLYEALTGEPPFRGALHLVLRQIQQDEPRPPRQLNDAVPRDLETVCLKAMAKEPARRYPGAADFAADLRRWLNGEPVRARPASRLERIWRWCRRKPRVAGLTAALVLALALGFAGITWQWLRAEANADEADRQRRQAEADFRRAEQSFRQAHEAVNRFLTEMGAISLVHVPGLEPVRRRLLEEALRYYQEFLKQRGDDPTLTVHLATAHGQIGQIHHLLGAHGEALAAYRKGAALLEPLAHGPPRSVAVARELADLHERWGLVLENLGQRGAARVHFQRGLDLLQPLARDRPADYQVLYLLGYCHAYVGTMGRNDGRLAEAAPHLHQALDLARQLVRARPGTYAYQEFLGLASNQLARLHCARLQFPEALAACEVCRTVCAKLRADYPDRIRPQYLLAHNCYSFGLLYRATGRTEEARRVLDQARVLLTAVARANPKAPVARTDLAGIHNALGSVYGEAGRWTEALTSLQDACALGQEVVDAHPGLVNVRVDLAGYFIDLGRAQRLTARRARALHSFRQAIAVGEKVLAKAPATPTLRLYLANAYNNLGFLQGEAGAYPEALRTLEKSRGLLEGLVKDFPDVPAHSASLATALGNRGKVLCQKGQVEKGLRSLRQAVALQDKVVQARPSVPESRFSLASICHALGTRSSLAAALLNKPQLRTEARQNLEKAYRLSEQVVGEQPANPAFRHLLAATANDLAELDRLGGRLADARRGLDRARELGERLVRDHPTVQAYRVDLARSHVYTGKVHATRQEFAPALAAYRQAQALQEKLVQADPENGAFRAALAETCRFSGLALWALGRREEAVTACRQGINHYTILCGRDVQTAAFRKSLSRVYLELGWVLRELGRRDDLAALADQRRRLWPRDPDECYFAAVEHALCIPLADKGKKDPGKDDLAERDRHAAAALDALRAAVRHGFRNRKLLETAPALAPLRDRPDFRTLLAEINRAPKGS